MTKKKVGKNIWYNKPIYHDTPLNGKDRDSIINYLYDTRIVPWYTTYLLQKKVDDVEVQEYMQEIWLQICNLSEEKLQDLLEQGKTALTAYIAVLIKQNCKSANSPAYCHIRKPEKRYVHIQDKDWKLYDEEGEFPDYLKNGALKAIEEYDNDKISVDYDYEGRTNIED